MCFLFLGVNANVGGSDSYGFEEGESFDDYNEFDSTRRSVVKFKEDDETEDSKEVIFSTNTLSSNFWKKKKNQKFGNREKSFTLSFKANLLTIHA